MWAVNEVVDLCVTGVLAGGFIAISKLTSTQRGSLFKIKALNARTSRIQK